MTWFVISSGGSRYTVVQEELLKVKSCVQQAKARKTVCERRGKKANKLFICSMFDHQSGGGRGILFLLHF
jgi:hypothetical protein